MPMPMPPPSAVAVGTDTHTWNLSHCWGAILGHAPVRQCFVLIDESRTYNLQLTHKSVSAFINHEDCSNSVDDCFGICLYDSILWSHRLYDFSE
jgi:hypothetical protein